MSESADVIVLAPEGAVRRHVLSVLPGATAYDAPLEALAELAGGAGRGGSGGCVFVAAASSMQYRSGEILRAVRTVAPEPGVYVVGSPEEEPQVAEMAAEGADDYFLVPFGLGDLARAVASREPARTIPLPSREASAERGPTGEARELLAGDARGYRSMRQCLRRVAELAHGAAGEVASGGVEALVAVEEISGARLVEIGRAPALVASAGEVAEGAGAVEAIGESSLRTDEWVQAADRAWAYVSATGEGARLALVVGARGEWLPGGLEDELTTFARVFLAVYSAAREREAAVRVLSTDAETGLASRRYFDPYVAALCRRAARRRSEVALAVFSPRGEASLVRASLAPLAAMLREAFAGAKLARLAEDRLAAVVTGERASAEAVSAALGEFSARVEGAGLPLPVAMAAATFPWQAGDAEALVSLAESRLETSRQRGFSPVVE